MFSISQYYIQYLENTERYWFYTLGVVFYTKLLYWTEFSIVQ
jgi:hypothetical protein